MGLVALPSVAAGLSNDSLYRILHRPGVAGKDVNPFLSLSRNVISQKFA